MKTILAILLASVAYAQINLPPVTVKRPFGGPAYLRIEATDGTYGGFKGPSSFTSSPVWTLPSADATGCLKSNGSLTLSLVGCGYWTRNSGSGYVYPSTTTDDVRTKAKLQLEDNSGAGSGLTMDIQAYVGSVAQTRAMIFRNNAGAEMLRLENLLSGVSTNRAIFDLSIEPLTDGTRALGSSSRYFTDVRGTDVYASTIRPKAGSSIDFYADLLPSATTTWALGSSSRRILKLWVQDLDCTGSCGASGWTRDASGFLVPTTATDDVRVRKLQILDTGGGGSGLMWDLLGTITVASTDSVYLRDRAGTKVMEFERSLLGSTSNTARLDMSLHPLTDGTRSLGSSSRYWTDIRGTDLYTATIRPKAGSSIESTADFIPSGSRTLGLTSARWLSTYSTSVYTDNLRVGVASTISLHNPILPSADAVHALGSASLRLQNIFGLAIQVDDLYTLTIRRPTSGDITFFDSLVPSSNNSKDLASSSARMRKVWTTDIDVSGTCTGCGGSSLFTDGGATTYLTATGDNLAIGGTSTSYKLEVASGNARLGGTLYMADHVYWETDAGGDIGTTTGNRPGSIHAATAVFTFDGGGSSVVRTSLSGSGLIVRNSSGTQKGVFAGSSGNIVADGYADMTNGFKVAGTAGITRTTATGCVFTLGILTGTSGVC